MERSLRALCRSALIFTAWVSIRLAVNTGHITSSDFSPAGVYQDSSIGDLYGSQDSGFYCIICNTLATSVTWTIGTAGEFTSVFQALGGSTSTYDFVLSTSNALLAGDVASTPEPFGLVFPLVGLLAVLAFAKRATRFKPEDV